MTKKERRELKAVLTGIYNRERAEILLKRFKFIKYNNIFIKVCKQEIEISNLIYYDNEGPKPEITKDLFIEEHLMCMVAKPYKLFYGAVSLGIVPFLKDEISGGEIYIIVYSDDEEIAGFMEADEELLNKINNAIKEVQTAYSKQLARHWRKNKNKIDYQGFWHEL